MIKTSADFERQATMTNRRLPIVWFASLAAVSILVGCAATVESDRVANGTIASTKATETKKDSAIGQNSRKDDSSHKGLESEAVSRSQARWNALLGKRYEELFSFLTATSRQRVTADVYARQMEGVGVREAKVTGATCEDEVCRVSGTLKIAQRVPRVGEVLHEIPFDERWVLSEGQLRLIR